MQMTGPGQGHDRQTSNAVLMVRPASFAFNAETAASNAFARCAEATDIRTQVHAEFDGVVRRLLDAGVDTLVLDDSAHPVKPDAIFPNNWVSFHGDGTMVLYPMAATTRRLERQPGRVCELLVAKGFTVSRTINLSLQEERGHFVEGTGSLVLDRPRRRAYANLSPRTHPEAVAEFATRLGFSTFLFDAADPAGQPIYHTNVVMSLGTRFALLCLDAVPGPRRQLLIDDIEASGRTVIPVTFDQVQHFACNVIELENGHGDLLIALSSTALASLRGNQTALLETLSGELIDADIPTIESVGGGGVRCMIADIHLPRRAATD